MAAEVGGRMEVVPARRSLFAPDYARLAVLGLVAAGVHAWLVAHTAVPARDAVGFARTALNLADPSAGAAPGEPRQRIDVIREAEQPPGFPAAVWATEKVLRRAGDLPLADRALLAAQLANAAAAVLLVVPMYLTGRILFGRNVGFAAALTFQVLPVPARVTSDGLSEGLYLLAACTALLFGVWAARRRSVGGFLLCGLATGAAYLVRPEGLVVGVGAGAVILAAGLARLWPRDVALGRLAALGVGVALVAVPYVVVIGKLTNKHSGPVLTHPFDPPARTWVGQPGADARPVGGAALFAEWWDPARDEGKNRALWALQAVWKETVKSVHYVVGVLAVVGLVARRRQLLAPDPAAWTVLAVGAVNLAILFFLAARVGYVSERHTVLVALLYCFFAAAALGPVARGLAAVPVLGRLVLPPRPASAVLLAVLVAAAAPYTFKPMHPQREGHRHAGHWLAAHAGPGDAVLDPLVWAEWYAGRTLHRPPVRDGSAAVVWAVWEKGKSPHSRVPHWDEVGQLAAGLEPVFRWPEGAPEGVPVVEVYRIERGKKAP